MADLDFIPASFHAAQTFRRHRRSQVVWGTVMVVVMCVWLWFHRVDSTSAQDRLAGMREQWTELQQSHRYYDALLAERDALARRQDMLEALDDPASLVVVLRELSVLLPEGTAATALTIDMNPPRAAANSAVDVPRASSAAPPSASGQPAIASSLRTRRPRLTLVGAGVSNVQVSDVAARLGSSALFRDVITQLVRDASYGEREVKQFEIECDILPHQGGPK